MTTSTDLPEIFYGSRMAIGANSFDSSNAPPLSHSGFSEAFQTRHPFDAHFVTYQLIGPNGQIDAEIPRLNKGMEHQAQSKGASIVMTCMVLDWDCPGHVSMTPAAFEGFWCSLMAFPEACDFSLLYTTAHGCRLVYILADPIPVGEAEGHLKGFIEQFHAHGIEVDEACGDWTRLFRLPHVMRDGVPTWESMLEYLPQLDNRLDGRRIPPPVGFKPASPGGIRQPFTISQPSEAEARALLTSDLLKIGKKNLGGRKCFDSLFKGEALAEPGARDDTLMEYLGEAIGMLFPLRVTAQQIYALFLPAVEQLTPDKETPDWLAKCWDMIGRIWPKEEAKAPHTENASPKSEKAPKESQASAMIRLAKGLDLKLFHDKDVAFGSLPVNGHLENLRLNSKGFRDWLCRIHYEQTGKAAGGQAATDAVNALAGEAIFAAPPGITGVRVAEHEGAICLDLCDPDWRVVKITPDGWNIISGKDCPIRFIRRRGMKALPDPQRGGSLVELQKLINAGSDEDWILIVSWLVMAMHGNGPYPALGVNGEQGSAKSTTCRILRKVIDPNDAELRTAPKDARDLMIAATNSRVVAFDNLSAIPPDLSDSMCRLATGAGFGTRQLYADDEEAIFSGARPQLFNGIGELATRPDLQDRCLLVSLPIISAEHRKDEAMLYHQFDEAHPRILGALLDAVVCALKHPDVQLASMPRMADFAKWIVAAEPALPWEAGKFLGAYQANIDQAAVAAVEASVVGDAIKHFMQDKAAQEGGYRWWFQQIHPQPSRPDLYKQWPMTATTLANAILRLSPSLRKIGIGVEHIEPGAHKAKQIRMMRLPTGDVGGA